SKRGKGKANGTGPLTPSQSSRQKLLEKAREKKGATSATNAKGLLNGFLGYWAGRLLPNQ
ncbi:11121_t:CDS:2, partial [Rhizophagus irregularis]